MPPIQRAKARRSRIHGTGLFATEDIPKGEYIIEYTGERITKAEAVRRYETQSEQGAIYLFDLNKRHDIDGASQGNDAKYANHSCDPNAETIIERGKIWIMAKKDIPKGAEILYDYNFPVFDHEKRPCRCGSDPCRGFIVSRRAYRYLQKKKAKKAGAKKGGKRPVRKTKGVAERHASGTRPASGRKAGKKRARKAAKRSGKTAGKKRAGKAAKEPRKTAGKKRAGKAAKKAGKKTRR